MSTLLKKILAKKNYSKNNFEGNVYAFAYSNAITVFREPSIREKITNYFGRYIVINKKP